jgi:hypothetical protein
MTEFESVVILAAAMPLTTAFAGRRSAADRRRTTAGSKREYSGGVAKEVSEHG